MADAGQLPPGWIAHWCVKLLHYTRAKRCEGIKRTSATCSSVRSRVPLRELKLIRVTAESESGHQQWEHPLENQPQLAFAQEQQAAVPAAGGKRRQYAVDQTVAYAEPAAYTDPGYPPQNVQQPVAGGYGQTFTPGEQLQQPGYYAAAEQNQYPAQPTYGVNQLADQFNTLGMGGQPPLALHSVNLLTTPPNPAELVAPPPQIRLPPGVSCSLLASRQCTDNLSDQPA